MELTTAIHNYNILSTLKPLQKLIVDSENKFQKDLRWGQFVRRAVTHDSKDQILKPLAETVNTMVEYFASAGNTEVVHSVILTLNEVEKTLLETYPNWSELSTCIQTLKEELTNDFDLEQIKSENVYDEYHPTEEEMIEMDDNQIETEIENNVIDLEDKIVLMEMDLTYIHLENKELKEKIAFLMQQMQTQISDMQTQIDILEEDQSYMDDYVEDEINTVKNHVNDKIFVLKQENEAEQRNLEVYIDENLDDIEMEFNNKIESLKESQRITMEDYVDENIEDIQSDMFSDRQTNKMNMAQLKTLQKLYYEKSKTNTNSIKDEIEEYLDTLDEDIETIFTFIKNRFCKSKQQ